MPLISMSCEPLTSPSPVYRVKGVVGKFGLKVIIVNCVGLTPMPFYNAGAEPLHWALRLRLLPAQLYTCHCSKRANGDLVQSCSSDMLEPLLSYNVLRPRPNLPPINNRRSACVAKRSWTRCRYPLSKRQSYCRTSSLARPSCSTFIFALINRRIYESLNGQFSFLFETG